MSSSFSSGAFGRSGGNEGSASKTVHEVASALRCECCKRGTKKEGGEVCYLRRKAYFEREREDIYMRVIYKRK